MHIKSVNFKPNVVKSCSVSLSKLTSLTSSYKHLHRYLKNIALLGLVSLLGACSSVNYKVHTVNGEPLTGEKQIMLDDIALYVVNGGDGASKSFLSGGFEDEVALGSGEKAVEIAFRKFHQHIPGIISEKSPILEDKALEIGTLNKSDYLIYSRVEKWSDPLGMNCGSLYYDEASVLLSIYSIEDKKLINTARLSAKSCPSKVNGIPISTGSPEALYEKLFQKWFNNNFKVAPKETKS